MRDKYDEAIEYLLGQGEQFLEAVHLAWMLPYAEPGGALFQYVITDERLDRDDEGVACGCLTQVHAGILPAETPALTAAIRADDRIPENWLDVTPENVHVFAEWQRRIDVELGRGQG